MMGATGAAETPATQRRVRAGSALPSVPMPPVTVSSADTSAPRTGPVVNAFGILAALFFLSGISGLMYEVVWVRMLTRILGSTVYATSTVLAAFMAGLALGSAVNARFIDRVRRPQRWYAVLELGIGLAALGTLVLPDHMLPLYQTLYDLAGGSRGWLTAGQVVLALLVLLVPTTLMGATLPTLCAYGGRCHQDFGRSVGLLYSLNTLGAVGGILASGFVLLGAVGETRTVVVGVLLNVAVAAAAWALGNQTIEPASPAAAPEAAPDAPAPYPDSCRRAVLLTFALGGFVALASEVVWGRMLLLYQGSSIYAFSAMLTAVLAGMGVGSLVGGVLVPRWTDPLRPFARIQLGVGLAAAVALHLFVHLGQGLFWPALVLLTPLGFLWGLAFPVGAACYNRSPARAGRSIGALYAWNTVGCIAGSLAAGFVLIPLLGSAGTLTGLAAVSLLLGALLLALHPGGLRRQVRWPEACLAGASVLLLWSVGDPYYRVLERKMLQTYPDGFVVMRHVEDATATMTVFRKAGDFPREKQLLINGNGMTALAQVTKEMAHLPIALADDPKDALVICFGMGTTVRSATRHKGLRVTAVELVPSVLDAYGLFHADGPEILARPTVHAVADDGRNYLLMHPQQYDVITIDPPPPMDSAGAVNLYTYEFFALCRARLQPGGVACLWLPGGHQSEVKMVMRTYLAAFRHVQLWAGPPAHPGWLLLGTHQPLVMAKVPAKVRKLYENPAVADDLRAWDDDLDGPHKLLDLYNADGDEVRQLLAGVPIITDDRPWTEFTLWRDRDKSSEYHKFLGAVPYKRQRRVGSVPDPYR
jgi:spermidine synthase